MGIGKPRSAWPVHFDRRPDRLRPGPADRASRGTRPAPAALRADTTALLPPDREDPDVRESLGTPSPTGMTGGASGPVRSHGTLLVLPRRDRYVDAATCQPPHSERGVASPQAHDRIGSGRHPERQTMNPPTRPLEPDIGQREEARDVVSAHTKTVAVQHRRRITVNSLVLAEDSVLEQRRDRRDAAPGNGRPETQPCHDPATVRLSSGPRGTVRRLVAERWKLGTTDIGSMLVPGVVHSVEHAHVARRGDIKRFSNRPCTTWAVVVLLRAPMQEDRCVPI